jgi:hypothetical protein
MRSELEATGDFPFEGVPSQGCQSRADINAVQRKAVNKFSAGGTKAEPGTDGARKARSVGDIAARESLQALKLGMGLS